MEGFAAAAVYSPDGGSWQLRVRAGSCGCWTPTRCGRSPLISSDRARRLRRSRFRLTAGCSPSARTRRARSRETCGCGTWRRPAAASCRCASARQRARSPSAMTGGSSPPPRWRRAPRSATSPAAVSCGGSATLTSRARLPTRPTASCSQWASTTARRSCGRRGTWKRVGRSLTLHTGRVLSIGFSPDGRTLVTSSADGTVALWDVATQKPLGTRLTVDPDEFVAAAFDADGSHVFAVSQDGRAFAGTSEQRRGAAARASSPAASSRARNGAMHSQSGPTRRSATFAETGIADLRGPHFEAEGEGFEPSKDSRPCRFSRPVHSTTLPPLRGGLS